MQELAARIISGDRNAISPAISLCETENLGMEARNLIEDLWPHTGHAATVGITGSPGVGKSTITSRLIEHLVAEEQDVGVIAIDPSSPISGGAILGDRVRMRDNLLHPNVFMRSFASRGRLGGLTDAAFWATTILDAAGKDFVLVETVGVGQSETEVKSLVDTVIVVTQPGTGDSIQMLKGGVLEIPDILCLNKIDQPDASSAKRQIKSNLLSANSAPIFAETDAEHDKGIDGLLIAIKEHRLGMGETGLAERRKAITAHQVTRIVLSNLVEPLKKSSRSQAGSLLLDQVAARSISPLEAAEHLQQIARRNGAGSTDYAPDKR